ncbi:putative serine dehydratase domain-containing protein [Dichotomopilus funicola]|uniref:D-serine dehydratase n=1 Tax=Dichotomopilus funicola TaxID=1934379 RepID=A0AAN6V3U3_9PEZI|nr:putative serine dehydratase domain-containing protein [Dichotomopilus funicola]
MTSTHTHPDSELQAQLRARFVGKNLVDVPTPSIVLDLAKVEANCKRMLDATDRLGLLWRAHIKSHKTTELTRLQVGDTLDTPVSLIVSTITEAENILPLLKEYQARGRRVNVLFSFPLFPSALPRLNAISTALGPDPSGYPTLTLMVDHPAQLAVLSPPSSSPSSPSLGSSLAHPPSIFLKIDTSYGRSGVAPETDACAALITAALDAEHRGACHLLGLYSHAGHSYYARGGTEDVAGYLADELEGLAGVAGWIRKETAVGAGRRFVLSVGATPTASVVQQKLQTKVEKLISGLKEDGLEVEIHAGVYPTLDMQQLATHASDATADDIAISVVAEVASLYPGRGTNDTTEVLINSGTLALGREPVADKGALPGQDYQGWGFLAPWGLNDSNNGGKQQPIPGRDFPAVHDGWQVGRISQEHGILTWHGRPEDEVPLQYGQKVRVWPNHSCIAGAGFDWYLIVDSRNEGKEDEVVDVWPRWRGW